MSSIKNYFVTTVPPILENSEGDGEEINQNLSDHDAEDESVQEQDVSVSKIPLKYQDYFKEIEDTNCKGKNFRVKCKICVTSKPLSLGLGTTGNIRKHLFN